MERKKRFCLRYAFQATIHAIWRERNKRKHDEKPLPIVAVMKMVDKGKEQTEYFEIRWSERVGERYTILV